MMLQIDGLTIFTKTATTLDFSHSTMTFGEGSVGEGSRRLCGSHQHPSSPWRQTTGVDRKGLGALLSPILGLLSTQMLHLNAGSVVPTHYGSWGAININIVAVSTCIEVVLSAVEFSTT